MKELELTMERKEKLRDFMFKNLLDHECLNMWEYYSDLRFYHIATPQITEKISGLLYGDDYSESVGEYVFISDYGEPIDIDELMKLEFDDKIMNSETQDMANYDILVQTISGLKRLVEQGEYTNAFDYRSGIKSNDLKDLTILFMLEELEKQL